MSELSTITFSQRQLEDAAFERLIRQGYVSDRSTPLFKWGVDTKKGVTLQLSFAAGAAGMPEHHDD